MLKLDKKLYKSVAEVAKELGISRIAVFKKIKKGQLPAKKIGRSYVIITRDVEQFLSAENPKKLSLQEKQTIEKAVQKTVEEYGETLRLLGKE